MSTVSATTSTRFVTSADGTRIAYDVTGTGPAVVVVEGALCQRSMGTAKALIPLLSQDHAVHAYDRRGRGESGPGSAPYAVEREVEDLVAVLEVAGPDALVVGASSGAALVLDALRVGVPTGKVALYEAPFIVDDTHAPNDPDLGVRTQALVDAGKRGEAVQLFMRTVGVPGFGVMMMRVMPVWKKLCGVAHTLPHDYAIVLERQQGEPLPDGWLAGVTTPVLVIVGGKSPQYMKNGQSALAAALPHGTLRELPGQTHMVKGAATVPALREFWAGVS
ncbi:alpha/beta hydrolase [Pedococcus ginsenosidimutans]|uniref:Alpha/beta hydrolase n=1 Tax=Pedococcus ginsenosidimutans TaxID=490570 RepID=A0ABP8XR87_9MICO